jgi:hypothetical protein
MSELGGRPPERRPQIGPADIADKERVARQHRLRLTGLMREVVHEDRNGLGRMSWCFEQAQPHLAEFEHIAVGHRREGVLGTGTRAQIDDSSCPIPQFQVAGDEVCVEVREEHVPDFQVASFRLLQVDFDVTPGIDHGRSARPLVANEVGRLRQTIEIELLQDHGAPPKPSASRNRGSGSRNPRHA